MKAIPKCPFDQVPDALKYQMQKALANADDKDDLLRASLVLERVSPLDWLKGVSGTIRSYGASRDRSIPLEVGGFGVADLAVWDRPASFAEVIAKLRATLDRSPKGVRYYGGFRFDAREQTDPDWRPFGSCRFAIPRFELRSAPEASMLSVHFRAAEAIDGRLGEELERLFSLSYEEQTWAGAFPPPRSRVDTPDFSGWKANVQHALQLFRDGDLQKVVLARKASLAYDDLLDPIHLLHRLKSATPDCYHFCYMPTRETSIVGASPERLYRREGRQIWTEAVAGTRPRSPDAHDDERLARELLTSDKDRREHSLVREGIRQALEPLCVEFRMDDQPSLLKLARGQHLFSAIGGILRDGVDDAALLSVLHPTPALGGWPTEKALAQIAAMEPFDRGWYAAPVGWVASDGAEFAVAIRSGLIQPYQLSLFSGAGIVEGSTPESEWDEIENKIADFIKVLTGA